MKLQPDTPGTLAERILDAFPSGAYALSALLRLMDIVETPSVPTAAVECTLQPRLLVNPDFVAKHADTPEKLLMLVMHELHHVLLGHTTLFPRVTQAQNFVFDAVINGVVCRMFPEEAYTRLFTDFYADDRFPECLLRPWAGWPHAHWVESPGIAVLEPGLRERTGEVHRALYSAAGASYHEVHGLLPRLLEEGGKSGQGCEVGAHAPGSSLAGVPLLGGHPGDGQAHDALEQRSPVLFDIVRGLVEQWPQPPDPIRGRSLADVLRESAVVLPPPSRRAVLRSLLRKVATREAGGAVPRREPQPLAVLGPVATAHRRSTVLRALGVTPLLHTAHIAQPSRVREGEQVHVYLDVSGSMEALIADLYGAVRDCGNRVHPVIHLFSTEVADVPLRDLRAGRRLSTDGTEIACVARHMDTHRVRCALLVTDGWVGTPRGEHKAILERVRLAVAFAGASIHEGDLAGIARHTARLQIGEDR